MPAGLVPLVQKLDDNLLGPRKYDGYAERRTVPLETTMLSVRLTTLALAAVFSAPLLAQQTKRPRLPENVETTLDIPYAETDNPRQRLDLLLPKQRATDKPLPVVVFIHGGGWRNGDKRSGVGQLARFVTDGNYAGVSIGYRLTDQGSWPTQIHDCKAAVRWIRGNAARYNLNPERIGIMGTSAGGHLVAMLGTSGGVESLEGKLGKYTDSSSRVTCVVDLFGPTELLTMGKSPGLDHDAPNSPESKLVGGSLQEMKEVARQASPITHVSKDDPPFMLVHGTDDPLVPFQQSVKFQATLKQAGVEATLIKMVGGKHGGFRSPELDERIRAFFDKHLRGVDAEISEQPIDAQNR